MPLEPTRTVAELKELRELTGDEDGAQRVAWTETWVRAQEWMADKLQGTGAETEFDEARNQWWTLRGRSEQELLIGGHLDSVPNGGWLFGSSAAAGSMRDQDELRQLTDRDGISLPEAIGAHGVDLDRARDAGSQLANAAAYLELHIEQGPVLESMDLPLGAVLGTYGVERHRVIWRGQAAHAGSTPMDQRRGPPAGGAKLALDLRHIAERAG